MPDAPQQDTTTTGLPTNLPNGGNNGGGLPTGGNNGGNGGGSQGSNEIVGKLIAAGTTYEFPNLNYKAEATTDEEGRYSIVLAYYTDEAFRDESIGLFDDGNTAMISYSASQAGVVETGSYQYDIQNNTSPFALIYFGSEKSGFVFTKGEVKVIATSNEGVYTITMKGDIVQIDEEFNIISEPIEVESELLTLGSYQPNARHAQNGIDAISLDGLRPLR